MQMRGTSNCRALCCHTLPSHFERWDGSGRSQPLRCISVAQSLLSLQYFLSTPLKRVCGSSSWRLPPQSLGDLSKILGTLFDYHISKSLSLTIILTCEKRLEGRGEIYVVLKVLVPLSRRNKLSIELIISRIIVGLRSF